MGLVNDNIKALDIDGIEATAENIMNNSYTLARPFLFVTKDKPTGLTKDFIDFILSSDGQEILSSEGLIPSGRRQRMKNFKKIYLSVYFSISSFGIICFTHNSFIFIKGIPIISKVGLKLCFWYEMGSKSRCLWNFPNDCRIHISYFRSSHYRSSYCHLL